MKRIKQDHELSRPLQVDRVSLGGMEEHIVASPDERAALAKRFGLADLPRLEAKLNIDHAEGKMLAVTGKLFADVVQSCVVTLEPVPEQVIESIDVLFAPPHLVEKSWDGAFTDIGDAEPPEPIENGLIDLGELVAQHLAAALNPYPRKEGAEIGAVEAFGQEKAGKTVSPQSPFAKLAALKKKE